MTDKPTLLIAGGGYADIPLIQAGKRLGYHVISSGNRAKDLGHVYADAYCPADFSDPAAVLAVAEREHISAICACCNDFSALSCAYVAEQMGLPGHDTVQTAQLLHHKDRFRQFSEEHGFRVPRAISVSSSRDALAASTELGFPLMVKPVDLTGGKGMTRVDHADQLEAAVGKAFAATRLDRIVVEAFIEGSRHGFSAFLRQGRVVFWFSDNEHYFKNPYLVEAASVPSTAPHSVEQQLIADAERYARLLSLQDGIFHIQYILHDDQPCLIEICRRAPGDLYIKLVEYATGVDYSEYIVRGSAGMDCSGLIPVPPRGCYVRHCIMPGKPGKLRSIHIDDSLRSRIIDEFCWWHEGDVVGPDELLTAKFGIVFLAFDSPEQMSANMHQIHQLIEPIMDPI